MIQFGIIGAGWRAEFFLRIARACPDQFTVTGLVGRTPAKTETLARRFGVPVFDTAENLVRSTKPLFVVTSLPWDVNPGMIKLLAEMKMAVLTETPPAGSIAEMTELCAIASRGAIIQVAEQYFLQPHHAARLAFAQSGKIGKVTQAQISVAHGYHGISLIRKFLGIGFENATITASVFKSPLVKGPGRAGPPQKEEIVQSEQIIAQLNFGDRLGIFDFTGDQYFAMVRDPRILIRGERGEIVNDTAVFLKDYTTPIRVAFTRHSAGEHGNLEGHYLKGIQAGEDWFYRNPLAPGALFDDEIAMGDCLLRMARHVNGGAPFYSVAEACQDRYLDIILHEAARENRAVTTQTQPWAK